MYTNLYVGTWIERSRTCAVECLSWACIRAHQEEEENFLNGNSWRDIIYNFTYHFWCQRLSWHLAHLREHMRGFLNERLWWFWRCHQRQARKNFNCGWFHGNLNFYPARIRKILLNPSVQRSVRRLHFSNTCFSNTCFSRGSSLQKII